MGFFRLKNVMVIIVSLVCTSILISCSDPEPPRCTITVIDSAGAPVPNATVYVNSDNSISSYTGAPGHVNDLQTTDDKGKTRHTFKLEAILQVDVWKDLGTGDSLKGKGSIHVVPDKVTEETITVRRK